MTDRSSRPAARRSPGALRALLRAISWHRRPLAVLAALLCVASLWLATSPGQQDRAEVLTVRSDLPAGHRLADGDLTVSRVPAQWLPGGAVTRVEQARGRVLTAGAGRGTMLTEVDLVAPTGLPDGQVRSVLRIADPVAVSLVQPGDRVTIVGLGADGERATVVAEQVLVVTVGGGDDGGGGLLAQQDQAALLVVQSDRETALALVSAQSTGTMGLVFG